MNRKVREMEFSEVDLMIDYFLSLDVENYDRLGVDCDKLPDFNEWQELLRKDFESTYEDKKIFYMVWELDDVMVGHSNIGKIVYGQEAYMHLHMWDPNNRQSGNGAYFVKESIKHYFEKFKLQNLYCEPHVLNPAPNKTLPKVGFKFVKSYETTPGWINVYQKVNRWVLTQQNYISNFR